MPISFEPRFGRAADAYQTFRPEYPPALFERILAGVPEGHRRRAMDLGSGTGLSARPLCRWFREVIAVEPDPRMAAKLAGLAPNVVVRNETAEDCAEEPESLDLVTAGTSFHWMDGQRALEKIQAWLRREGVLAVYSYGFPGSPQAVRAIIGREFELHWERYRHERLRDAGYARRTLEASSGWSRIEAVSIPYVLDYTPEQLAGFCRSTSYGSAYTRTLANPAGYWKDLESSFRQAHPDGMIPLDFQVSLILAWKA